MIAIRVTSKKWKQKFAHHQLTAFCIIFLLSRGRRFREIWRDLLAHYTHLVLWKQSIYTQTLCQHQNQTECFLPFNNFFYFSYFHSEKWAAHSSVIQKLLRGEEYWKATSFERLLVHFHILLFSSSSSFIYFAVGSHFNKWCLHRNNFFASH